MRVHFLLICEGSSDEALISHLRSLLVDCGVEEASGAAPDFNRLPRPVSKDIESKVRAVLELEERVDLLFIHRDADSPDPEPRYREISNGIKKANCKNFWIGVVPIQAIEAWLLLDESAIRRVSGRPNGQIPLNLPTPNHVEGLANPKNRLFDEIIRASETTGRKRRQLEKKLPALRTYLLSELKIGGELLRMSSWMRLRDDIMEFIQEKVIAS